jgi:hypothetical protein
MAGNCLSHKEVHIEGWWTNSSTAQDNDGVGNKERLMGVPASGAKVEDNSLISKLECEPRQKWVTFLEKSSQRLYSACDTDFLHAVVHLLRDSLLFIRPERACLKGNRLHGSVVGSFPERSVQVVCRLIRSVQSQEWRGASITRS